MSIPKISNIYLLLTLFLISVACDSSTTPGENLDEEPTEMRFKQENGCQLANSQAV